MKRQKRDRFSRAQNRGFVAAMHGRSRDECPYQNTSIREFWLSGWREARASIQTGLF